MSDETRPDLHETAWARAKADAGRVYRSGLFQLGAALVQAVVLPLAILLADDGASTEDKIAATVLFGAVALTLTVLIVLITKVVTAPATQRNELRRAWPSGPIEKPVDVRLSLLNYARQIQDLTDTMREYGFRRADEDRLDALTQEVTDFMASRATSDQTARFIAVNEQVDGRYPRAVARIELLREIAKEH
jgi:hypothetical protein